MTFDKCLRCGKPARIGVSGRPSLYCSERCRKWWNHSGVCEDCGGETSGTANGGGSVRKCLACASRANGRAASERQAASARKRYRTIERLWAQGASLKDIADELGTSHVVVGSTMTKMRKLGWKLPYRYRVDDSGRRLPTGGGT